MARARRSWSRLSTAAFIGGVVLAVVLIRQIPPAPAFSPRLGRATYWQSYENAYFASLRSYEQPIRDLLAAGYVPIVIFGDSTFRGTGAVGDDIWTRLLEKRLQAVNARVRVVNYAQNAGDLLAPFLYHHLQKKFPEARYIVQWPFASEVGIRHPFHLWLTSEIALRDGQENPAVRRSFNTELEKKQDNKDEEKSEDQKKAEKEQQRIAQEQKIAERYAFALAALNIATNCLDACNWIRYLWAGRPFFDADRVVKIQPLRDVAEADVSLTKFVPLVDVNAANMLRGFFLNYQKVRDAYVQRPLADRAAYFAEMYPAPLRDHLLIVTLDFNPYYAPHGDETLMNTWRTMWSRLRADMAQIPDLRWVSLTGAAGEFETDDFCDLGHLTIQGQRKLANAVADKLLAPGGWFDPATTGTQLPPRPVNDR